MDAIIPKAIIPRAIFIISIPHDKKSIYCFNYIIENNLLSHLIRKRVLIMAKKYSAYSRVPS
jgi:hypothetical protein